MPLFGKFGKRRGLGPGRGRGRKRRCRRHAPRPLATCHDGERCLILGNSDKQTLEMGLFNGVRILVVQNNPREPNMVVAVGDARYAIHKSTAEQIIVR